MSEMKKGFQATPLRPIMNSLYIIKLFTLISVRSWNFKDGGSFKTSFLAKNQHGNKEKSLKKSSE